MAGNFITNLIGYNLVTNLWRASPDKNNSLKLITPTLEASNQILTRNQTFTHINITVYSSITDKDVHIIHSISRSLIFLGTSDHSIEEELGSTISAFRLTGICESGVKKLGQLSILLGVEHVATYHTCDFQMQHAICPMC